MGSSIEAAITISAVILILSALIILPIYTFADCYYFVKEGVSELTEYNSDLNSEDICTLLTGFSESYRILIGGN